MTTILVPARPLTGRGPSTLTGALIRTVSRPCAVTVGMRAVTVGG